MQQEQQQQDKPRRALPVFTSPSPPSMDHPIRLVSADLLDRKSGVQSVRILSHYISNGSVYYAIGFIGKRSRWFVARHFQEFYVLNQYMEVSFGPSEIPPFPDKSVKLWTDHLDKNFIHARLALLDNYLQTVFSSNTFRSHAQLITFCTPQTHVELTYIEHKPQKDEKGHQQDQQQRSKVFEPRHGEDQEWFATLSARVRQENIWSGSGKLAEGCSTGGITSSSSGILDDEMKEDGIIEAGTKGNGKATDLYAEDGDPDEEGKAMGADFVCDEVSNVFVTSAQIVKGGYVVYQINVENIKKRLSFSRWTILKRFQDFAKLYNDLVQAFAKHPDNLREIPLLPSKYSKSLVDHLQPRFIEKRRILLELFLKKCINTKCICDFRPFLDFLGVD